MPKQKPQSPQNEGVRNSRSTKNFSTPKKEVKKVNKSACLKSLDFQKTEPEKKSGRPPLDKYDLEHMCKKIDEYIAEKEATKEVPIFKECCLKNDWYYVYVYELVKREDYKRLSESINKLLAHKEIYLEVGALKGTLNTSMAIFSLKQMPGWTDKQTLVHAGSATEPLTIKVETSPLVAEFLNTLKNKED